MFLIRSLLWVLLPVCTPPVAAQQLPLLPASIGAPVTDVTTSTPFNVRTMPIQDADFLMLTDNGYKFDEQGRLLPPDSKKPVPVSELFYVVEEVRSNTRLKALIQLNLIFSRNDYSEDLPRKDREEVRRIGRETWRLLARPLRLKLKPYFTAREYYELNQAQPSASPPPDPILDMPLHQLARETLMPEEEPSEKTPGEPEAEEPGTAAPGGPMSPGRDRKRMRPAGSGTGPQPMESAAQVLTPLGVRTAPSAKPSPVHAMPAPWEKGKAAGERPSPRKVEAMPAPWEKGKAAGERPAADRIPVSEWEAESAGERRPAPWEAAAPSAAKTPVPPPAAAPEPSWTKAVALPAPWDSDEPPPLPEFDDEASKKPSTADMAAAQAEGNAFMTTRASPPPVASVSARAPLTLPPPPPPERPAEPVEPPEPEPVFAVYPEFDAKGFEEFLKGSDYGERVRKLLSIIAAHAAGDDRRAAAGFVRRWAPEVVLDARGAGTNSRYSLTRVKDGAKNRLRIVLHDGPAVFVDKHLLGPDRIFWLSDDPAFYGNLGLPMPKLDALVRGSRPTSTVEEDWGRAQAFKDGSMRLLRSDEQLAGMLLHALLDIDAALAGVKDAFDLELRSSAAEFRLYQSLEKSAGKDVELDIELLARYREWKDRPEDYADFMLATRGDDLIRFDIGLLEDAGLVDERTARDAKGELPEVYTRRSPPRGYELDRYKSRLGGFTAEVPREWTVREAETPRGTAVHLLGPPQARGTMRAAYHIHLFERGKPDFTPSRTFLKTEAQRDKTYDRQATLPITWRVDSKPSRLMEVRETRMLPFGRLPAAGTHVHHFYAFVPAGREGYYMIKLTTAEEDYLRYRKEFKRFLKSFRISAY